MTGLGGKWRICAEEGCNARCGHPHTRCQRHRPRYPQKPRTKEQRRRYNAATRARYLRRAAHSVLSGVDVL